MCVWFFNKMLLSKSLASNLTTKLHWVTSSRYWWWFDDKRRRLKITKMCILPPTASEWNILCESSFMSSFWWSIVTYIKTKATNQHRVCKLISQWNMRSVKSFKIANLILYTYKAQRKYNKLLSIMKRYQQCTRNVTAVN